MAKSEKISTFWLIVFIIIGFIVAYQLVVLVINICIYAGFNSSFFLDNLLQFNTINPLLGWGILGLLIGSVFGVLIAVRKLKLNSSIILYPVLILLVFVVLMFLINKPSSYNQLVYQSNSVEQKDSSAVPGIILYSVSIDANVRSAPSSRSKIEFVISAETPFQIVESDVLDSRNRSWSKIKYYDREGYVLSKFIKQYRHSN